MPAGAGVVEADVDTPDVDVAGADVVAPGSIARPTPTHAAETIIVKTPKCRRIQAPVENEGISKCIVQINQGR